jgi:hypothetical protein
MQLLAPWPGDLEVEVSPQGGRGRLLVGCDERDDRSFGSRPAGTTGAVHVVLGIRRHVEVDDTRHVVYMNATSRDVRRHQRLHLVGPKSGQGPVTL